MRLAEAPAGVPMMNVTLCRNKDFRLPGRLVEDTEGRVVPFVLRSCRDNPTRHATGSVGAICSWTLIAGTRCSPFDARPRLWNPPGSQ